MDQTSATPSISPLERGRMNVIPLLSKEGLGVVAEDKKFCFLL